MLALQRQLNIEYISAELMCYLRSYGTTGLYCPPGHGRFKIVKGRCRGGSSRTMVVALVANHVQNGFFIFRSGEGYEYVLMIALVSGAVGALGAGGWSVDHVAGFTVPGWAGLAIAALAGAGGAALLLATSWRPGPAASQAPAASVPSSTPA